MASRGLRLWSSLAGLAFVVLAIVGAILLFDGPSDSSPAKMTSYYDSSSNRTHIHIGWVLAGLGLFALIWFVAALRERVRASEQATPEEGTFLSTVVLVGGTVYIAVTMAAIAVADGMRAMSDDTYQHRVYSGVIHAAGDASYLLVVTAGAAMASLIFATSVATRSCQAGSVGSVSSPAWQRSSRSCSSRCSSGCSGSPSHRSRSSSRADRRAPPGASRPRRCPRASPGCRGRGRERLDPAPSIEALRTADTGWT